MRGFLFSSFALAALNVASAQRCKCLPGDDCFPSADAWKAFGSKLSQPLITDQKPLGAVCYADSDSFDAGLCAQFAEGYNSEFVTTHPNVLQFGNHEGHVTETEVLHCPLDASISGKCHQGRVPSYVITATTIEDVQHTISFATEHDLHLVVRNTGHEFMGRAFGVGSVELYTNKFQGIEFTDSFVPRGAPSGTAGQEAVTIGSGVNWADLYKAADDRNKTVVGGWSVDASVGAGAGWPLGGGHSILAPYYGLGVDNVLEINVVLPNTSFVTANEFEYPDLFWALRGGGGPNFGVVTSLTYKTHPSPIYTVAYFVATADSSETFLPLLTTFLRFHNPISDAGWAGTWVYVANNLFLSFSSQGTPEANPVANATFEEFFTEVKALPGVFISQAFSVQYPSIFPYIYDNLFESSRGFGFNWTAVVAPGNHGVSSSWLIPRETTAPENAAAAAEVFAKIPIGLGFFTTGGAVSEVPEDAMSVCPAMRRSISDFTTALNWEPSSSAEVIHATEKALFDSVQTLRDFAPQSGQYVNEADPLLLKGWAEATWGANYPRLRALKQEVDPKDLFIVRQGPNSEGWDLECICKEEPSLTSQDPYIHRVEL